MVSRAKDTHTTNRPIRISDEDWNDLGEATENRSQVIRDLIAWYLRRPKAKLPTRPPAA